MYLSLPTFIVPLTGEVVLYSFTCPLCHSLSVQNCHVEFINILQCIHCYVGPILTHKEGQALNLNFTRPLLSTSALCQFLQQFIGMKWFIFCFFPLSFLWRLVLINGKVARREEDAKQGRKKCVKENLWNEICKPDKQKLNVNLFENRYTLGWCQN